MEVKTFENLIGRQPGFLKTFEKFNDWLESLYGLAEDNQQTVVDIITATAIDNAEGVLLDILGELVGIKRTQIILDSGTLILDADYRKVIKGKIAQNYFDGTATGMEEILNIVFAGEFQFVVQDNQDMSIDIFILGILSSLDEELLIKGYYTPKPMGVNINYFEVDPITFGWDLDTALIKGWDSGYWTGVL